MNAKKRIPSYAYLRVSSQGQIDGNGFERQESAIKRHARGTYEVCDTFRDAFTGTDADRPEFNLMCERILKNCVRTILIEDLSRLARDSMVQQLLLAKLADLGITLINCSTGQNVTADVAENPMLKAMVQIQGVFAELEKANLVGKLRHAREAKAAATGKCEGAKAYGECDPAEQETVALMRQLRRKRSGKRLGYGAIAAELNQRGIAPRRGKQLARKDGSEYP